MNRIHSWFIHSRSPAARTVSQAPHEEYKRGPCPLTILGADRATGNQQKSHEGGFIQGRRLGAGRAARQTRHPGAGTSPAFTAPPPLLVPTTQQRGHQASDERALRQLRSTRVPAIEGARGPPAGAAPACPAPSAYGAPSREPSASPVARAGERAGAPRTRTGWRSAPSGVHRAGAATMEGGAYTLDKSLVTTLLLLLGTSTQSG